MSEQLELPQPSLAERLRMLAISCPEGWHVRPAFTPEQAHWIAELLADGEKLHAAAGKVAAIEGVISAQVSAEVAAQRNAWFTIGWRSGTATFWLILSLRDLIAWGLR